MSSGFRFCRAPTITSARGSLELAAAQGLQDVLVVVGGIIPDVDVPRLKALGIAEIFLPGTPMQAIVDFIRAHVRSRADHVVSRAHPSRASILHCLDRRAVSR